MHYLSIGCIFKNESNALFEFIEHYLYHGVDHFFMINDFSSDNYLEILQPYIDSGKITLFQNDIITKEPNRQIMVYEKFFRNILNETKWLAILDLDEFLFSPIEIDVKNIIKKYEDYSQLRIEWITYGSNQCFYQPFSIVSGFNKHCNLSSPEFKSKFYSYKSIFKTERLYHFGIHSSIINGNEINLSYSSNINELFINHYQLQSLDFYINVKGTRGDVNNHYDLVGLQRDINHFNNNDSNEIECNTLIEQNREIIKKVKDYKLSKLTDRDVTVIITSCNRPSLLEKTLDSFFQFNTYPIKEFIIIDDSGHIGVNDFILNKYNNQKFKLLYNNENIGQVKSIDKAYEYITTKYVFHCEEDWEFLKPSFIERSFEILDDDPKIYTVWLRPHRDTSGHPIDYSSLKNGYYSMKKDFSYEYKGKIYTWCGVTFNPGLRRTSDILLFHPYCHYIQKDDELGEVGEYVINDKYRNLGFYGAITDEVNGYVTHIGYGHHVRRKYD